MPDWLANAFVSGQEIHLDVLALRLAAAFLLGLAVAGIYWATHRRDETLVPSFLSTLVLLSILIAMVTQVIGDSVARAFSLVGALSIVRFRTVVEDTRDTAFVIFAVIVGMAAGAGHVWVAVVGLPVVAGAAAVMQPRGQKRAADPYWTLTLRIGLAQTPDKLVADLLSTHFGECHLLATSTARQGAALEMTYKVRLRPAADPTAAVSTLNRAEGVQSVELRRLG